MKTIVISSWKKQDFEEMVNNFYALGKVIKGRSFQVTHAGQDYAPIYHLLVDYEDGEVSK